MALLRELAQELPCGCSVWKQIRDGEREFVMVPCSMDCEYLKWSMEETRSQRKPVIFREQGEDDG